MTSPTPTPGSAAGPPPGWYDDPHRRFDYRYFNGERWTADVSTDGERTIDPLGQAATPFATGQAPTAPASRRAQRLSRASFWVALPSLIVAWLPFIFIGAIGGAIVAGVFGMLAFRAARESNTARPRFAIAGVVMAPIALALCVVGGILTVVVVREVERFARPGDFELVENLPCSVSGTTVTFDGAIRNLETNRRAYSLTVEYRDGTRVVQKATVDVDTIAPQERAEWHTTAFIDGDDITCSVSKVAGPRPFGLPSP